MPCKIAAFHKYKIIVTQVNFYTQVCEHFRTLSRGGGQNQKLRHTGRAARPTGETAKGMIAHIKGMAVPSLLPEEDPFPVCQDSLAINLHSAA